MDRRTTPRPREGSPEFVRQTLESAWCGRRDSNPHNFRHWNLNPARLPVPPRPLNSIMSGRDAAGGAAYNMCPPVRSKKMAGLGMESQTVATGHSTSKMVRIGLMARANFLAEPARADGRTRGRSAGLPRCPRRDRADARPRLALQAKADSLAPAPGRPGHAGLVACRARPPVQARRIPRSQLCERPAGPGPFRSGAGIGAASADPLTGAAAGPAGATESLQLPLRYAGTFLCDLRLLGDGQARPIPRPGADRSGEGADRCRPRRNPSDRRLAVCGRTELPLRPARTPEDTTAGLHDQRPPSRRTSPSASTSG